ncbi:hypothetical protein C8J56DRAFT_883478 [Mycena floridula]|nr:hypothetical protein C8J56DRAFT_883478 [Mycena floridula]
MDSHLIRIILEPTKPRFAKIPPRHIPQKPESHSSGSSDREQQKDPSYRYKGKHLLPAKPADPQGLFYRTLNQQVRAAVETAEAYNQKHYLSAKKFIRKGTPYPRPVETTCITPHTSAESRDYTPSQLEHLLSPNLEAEAVAFLQDLFSKHLPIPEGEPGSKTNPFRYPEVDFREESEESEVDLEEEEELTYPEDSVRTLGLTYLSTEVQVALMQLEAADLSTNLIELYDQGHKVLRNIEKLQNLTQGIINKADVVHRRFEEVVIQSVIGIN